MKMRKIWNLSAFVLAAMLLIPTAVQAQETPEPEAPPQSEEAPQPEDTPQSEEARTAEEAPQPEEAEQPEQVTLSEVVAGTEELSTFAAALEATGLADQLAMADQSYTVFAPTNAAFDNLPEGKLEKLMQPEHQERLRSILLHHVVSGPIASTEVADMNPVETLHGATVPVETDGVTTTVGDAVVVEPDVAASNGVVHVIDAVLLPQDTPEDEKM